MTAPTPEEVAAAIEMARSMRPLIGGGGTLLNMARALLSEHAARTAAERELMLLAEVIEPHWRGAGAPLEAKWMIDEYLRLAHDIDAEGDRADAAEGRAEALRDTLRELVVCKDTDCREMTTLGFFSHKKRIASAWSAARAALSPKGAASERT